MSRLSDNVIELEHVAKRFGDFVAVHEANFTIARGEFFAMLGPSGCGKTTTLRMIAGFEIPTSGAIKLEGVDVSHVPPYRRNVNTVFQQYALFPHMNVWDNIAFGPRSSKVKDADVKQRVDEIIEVVRLGEFVKRKPNQLSGGQQQRVALARALVNFPSALLLDEPLAALDLKLRQAMQIELKRIQREVGITFIFVTHDQEEALTLSDRIAVMSDGRVEQIGTPIEIYNAPQTTFVAGFIGQANLFASSVMSISDGMATVKIADNAIVTGRISHSETTVGDSVTFMVRPERVRLRTERPSAIDSALSCTVIDYVFQGPVVRYALRAPNGQEIAAYTGADDTPLSLRANDQVWVTWDVDAARVLPAASVFSVPEANEPSATPTNEVMA